jgi:hypothetical protein
MSIFISCQAYGVHSNTGSYSGQAQAQVNKHYIQTHNSDDSNVINIIIDKIDNNVIYSKNGRAFPVTTSTQIINNHKSTAKVQIGELFFKDGSLTTVIIK